MWTLMDEQEQRNGAQMGQESGRKSDLKEKKNRKWRESVSILKHVADANWGKRPRWWGRTEIWNWAAGGWRESDVGWWRGCEDGKGKLRRGMSDGARRSKGRRRDESEKGKTAGKICPNELSCLQIYVVLWLSLCINQRRWGDSSNATPKRECACVYLCMHCSALLFSLSTLPLSPPKQTNFWIWQNPRLWWGNIHQHPQYIFPKSIYLALLVERRED